MQRGGLEEVGGRGQRKTLEKGRQLHRRAHVPMIAQNDIRGEDRDRSFHIGPEEPTKPLPSPLLAVGIAYPGLTPSH